MMAWWRRLWRFGERIGRWLADFSRRDSRLGEICFGVVAASLALHWFNPVTTPAFSALGFPLLEPAHLWPKLFTPFSYGVPALLLCVIGYIGWRAKKHWIVLGVASLLLLLGARFFLEITCWQPSWLREAIEGGVDFNRFYSFEVSQSIPDAVRGAPAGDLSQAIDGLPGRISGGISALSSGWYFYMSGALLCFIAGLSRRPGRNELAFVLWSSVIIGVPVLALQLSGPVQGEFQIAQGVVAANRGAFSDAVNHFRRAMEVDKWNQLRPDIYQAIGAVFEATGQKDQPEYHLYRAAQYVAVMKVYQALFELDEAAARAEPALAAIIRKVKSDTAQVYGKDLYLHGLIGEARKQLEIAIAATPERVAGYYLAGVCCYEGSDYVLSIDYLRRALTRTSEATLTADLRSTLGDCYFKLGDVNTARGYYMSSRAADDRKNFRALKSLAEDYYR
jgi:tetratricopeptide (TPR) repeat protein